MKSSIIYLSSELTQEIACNGQRSGPWTANGGTITTSLETTTSTWGSQVPMQSHMYSDKIEIPSGFGTGLCAYWAGLNGCKKFKDPERSKYTLAVREIKKKLSKKSRRWMNNG